MRLSFGKLSIEEKASNANELDVSDLMKMAEDLEEVYFHSKLAYCQIFVPLC